MKKLLAITLAFLCAAVAAQTAVQTPTQRLRGTVKSVDGATLVLAERSGETISLAIADNFSVVNFMREVTCDTELGGVAIPRGPR